MREQFAFKSEAKELLQLMAHSLYSGKDVFLRELISNASDALDKRRFESLTNAGALGEEKLEIRISADAEARTLTVADNGIGMNREELIENLGTIAHSGTKAFVEKLKQASTESQAQALIGQFGVGFYSSFIVAKEVSVKSRRLGEEKAYEFTSTGDGDFAIEECQKDDVGTTIVLTLKDADPEDNLDDFTNTYVIKNTIRKYSDFVQYPITLYEEVPQTAEEGEEKVRVFEWNRVNSMKAVWLKSASDVSEQEYKEFYQHVTHDWAEPLLTIPVKAEGTMEYHALLFIPKVAPFDMNYRDAKYGLRLHAQHIMVVEQCQETLPEYLRFVKGVVDSSDLNLNISREILQKDRRISTIRKHLTKKVLDNLENIAKNDAEKYAEFWKNYGRTIKEGASSDYDNRKRLLDLIRFVSTRTLKKDGETPKEESEKQELTTTSFAEYVENMKLDQKEIYVISGETLETLKNSPHLEAFVERDYEVLFLTDAFDEILFSTVTEYDGKAIKFIGRGEVELGSEEEKKEKKEKIEEQAKNFEKLIKALETALSSDVDSVRISTRLTSSPACLVGLEGDISPHIQRLLSQMGNQKIPAMKRILEINPAHALIEKLRAKVEENEQYDKLAAYANILYCQSLLSEGSPIPDPVEFTKNVTALMADAL